MLCLGRLSSRVGQTWIPLASFTDPSRSAASSNEALVLRSRHLSRRTVSLSVALWLSNPLKLNWLEGEMNWLAQGRVTL
jgi:hypothetical protein